MMAIQVNRCAYGRALIAFGVLNAAVEGYHFNVHGEELERRLRSHDRFCRECAVADDSTHPDAEHLRKLSEFPDREYGV